jgi:tetratricopeptide (TPR) repeat protein/predicted Ser/Thr protein kinase
MTPAPGCPPDEVVVELIEGRLAPARAAELEAHVDRCAACAELLATYGAALVDGAPGPARLGPGARVGRYLVIDFLGAGGMGVVYAAFDPQLDRKVALKLIRRDAGGDPVEQARLVREAQALARLNHPNATAVYDAGHDGGRLFLAMEFVDGGDLAAWLRTPRTMAEIVRVFAAAGRGLEAAHAAGLVHRDFKPANVLVDRGGQVKVSDFGLARLLDRAPPHDEAGAPTVAGAALTLAGAVVGTPGYLAPEQLRGDAVDARGDQFAFCAALFEALYARRPYVGDTVEALAASYRTSGGPSVPRDRQVPSRLRVALTRGLALEPTARFPSMTALLAAIAPPPRRRWWLVGAGLVAALAAAAWIARGDHAGPPLCAGAGRAATAAWTPADAAQLEAAFGASGVPSAVPMARSVAATLGRQAAALGAMQVEACTAARVDGTQSELVLDLRTACLARVGRELDATIAVLRRAEPTLISRAPDVVAELTPLARCADVESLRASERPPPWQVLEVDAAAAALAAAQAELRAGHSAAVAPTLAALATRAAALGYRPLEAEVALARAELQDLRGEHADALASAQAAVFAAMAGRDDATLFAGCHTLAEDLLKRDGVAAAEPWLRCAAAIAERLHAQPAIAAELRYLEAEVADRRGDARAAFELHTRALAAAEAAGAAAPARMRMLQGLGVQALELGRADDALAFATRAVALGREALGADHVDVARAELLLGYARGASHDPRGALAALAIARPVLEREFGAAHEDVASLHEAMANADDELHDDAAAVAEYLVAIAIRRKALGPRDPSVAASLYNLATTLNRGRRFAEALRYLDEAEPIYAAANSPDHVTVGVCAFERGRALAGLGRDAEALAALERARPILVAQLDDAATLGELGVALARARWSAGRRDDARAAMAGAAAAYRRAGDAAAVTTAEAWLVAHPK